MPKLFTYGDSFTDYLWSTWADIIAKNFSYKLEQKGVRGCGNNFIYFRLKEDIRLGLIKPLDHVMVMWSYFNRVSDIKNYNTFTAIKETHDPLKQEKNSYDSCQMIIEVEKLLLDKQIDYDFLSWLPIPKQSDRFLKQNLLKPIKPSFIEIVYKNNWMSKIDRAIKFDETKMSKFFKKHLYRLAEKKNISVIQLIRQQSVSNPKLEAIFDLHPTPLHHLEYLQIVYPNIIWNPNLIAEIHQENQQVLSKIW